MAPRQQSLARSKRLLTQRKQTRRSTSAQERHMRPQTCQDEGVTSRLTSFEWRLEPRPTAMGGRASLTVSGDPRAERERECWGGQPSLSRGVRRRGRPGRTRARWARCDRMANKHPPGQGQGKGNAPRRPPPFSFIDSSTTTNHPSLVQSTLVRIPRAPPRAVLCPSRAARVWLSLCRSQPSARVN